MKRVSAAGLLVGCWLLGGCGLLSPPKPEPVRALLTKVPGEIPREHQHGATLLVLSPETSPTYDTTRMAYSERRYEIGYFRDNEWTDTPGQMLEGLLVRTLRDIGFFKTVLTSSVAARPTYQLRTTIVELLQDHTSNPPILRLALRVQLLDSAGQPIADRDIRHEEVLQEATPYSGVVAANDATALALHDVAQFVLEAVRRAGG